MMLLKYYVGADGKRIYTLTSHNPEGKVTNTAHPAKFSPDDPYSEERIECKRRFNLLLTQTAPPQL
jgi:H/ACA ribonucleoprotein complex subunit 3